MEEQEDFCLFCRRNLEFDSRIDVENQRTEQGVNINEFIKESILGAHAHTLQSNFLCDCCYDDVNNLESYMLKCKDLQECLLNKYLHHQVEIKVEAALNTATSASIITNTLEITSSANTEGHTEHTDLKIKLGASTDTDYDSSDLNISSKRAIKKPLRRKSLTENKVSPKSSKVPQRSPRKHKVKRKTNSKAKEHIQLEGENVVDQTLQDDKSASEQTYCCEVCGKVTKRANAAKHMNIHTKKNLYICEYCNKNFTQKVDLRRHLNIHMGIFPYVCEFCGKKFAQHTSYNIHKKNHLGLREFKCIVCDKAMLSKSHLVRHMKTHTSEKNYECLYCGKTFAEKYNMTSHMRKIHQMEASNHRVQEIKINAEEIVENFALKTSKFDEKPSS